MSFWCLFCDSLSFIKIAPMSMVRDSYLIDHGPLAGGYTTEKNDSLPPPPHSKWSTEGSSLMQYCCVMFYSSWPERLCFSQKHCRVLVKSKPGFKLCSGCCHDSKLLTASLFRELAMSPAWWNGIREEILAKRNKSAFWPWLEPGEVSFFLIHGGWPRMKKCSAVPTQGCVTEIGAMLLF